MYVGKGCLANGFYVGTLPDRFQTMSFVERAAVYPIRIKGCVVALESRRVNNAGDTAKRSLCGTSVFYANISSSVKELPLAAADCWIWRQLTVVLAREKKAESR